MSSLRPRGWVAVTSAQVRAARAILGWTQAKLAKRAGLSPRTTATFEAGKTLTHSDTNDQIRNCLEAEGISFITDAGNVGVSMTYRR